MTGEYCSGKVNKHLFVLFITLHITSLDKHLDLFFNHLRLCLEHLDHVHDFSVKFHICNCLTRLENLDSSRLDNDLSFGFNLLGKLIVPCTSLGSLLLCSHGRDQIDSDIVARKLHVQFDLFIQVIQSGLLNLLVQDTDLRITEMDDSWLQEFIWNV